MSVSFFWISFFLIYKKSLRIQFYLLGLVFSSSVLVKRKWNYKKVHFFKESEKKGESMAAGEREFASWWSMRFNRVVRLTKPWMVFRALKTF